MIRPLALHAIRFGIAQCHDCPKWHVFTEQEGEEPRPCGPAFDDIEDARRYGRFLADMFRYELRKQGMGFVELPFPRPKDES